LLDSDVWLRAFKQIKNTGKSYALVKYQIGFTPFVLGYKKGVDLPQYWHALRGQGFGQNSWIMEAHRQGFAFGVLKDFFVCEALGASRPK